MDDTIRQPAVLQEFLDFVRGAQRDRLRVRARCA